MRVSKNVNSVVILIIGMASSAVAHAAVSFDYAYVATSGEAYGFAHQQGGEQYYVRPGQNAFASTSVYADSGDFYAPFKVGASAFQEASYLWQSPSTGTFLFGSTIRAFADPQSGGESSATGLSYGGYAFTVDQPSTINLSYNFQGDINPLQSALFFYELRDSSGPWPAHMLPAGVGQTGPLALSPGSYELYLESPRLYAYANTTATPDGQPQQKGWIASVSFSIDAAPAQQREPTPLELAMMSQQAYEQNSSNVGEYQLHSIATGDGGFSAKSFRSGDNIVIAIRGTVGGGTIDSLKNMSADKTFAEMNANATFKAEVDVASQFLADLHSECPDCKFYITGHSLGGAIAEIVGGRANLPSVGFDAPGVGSVVLSQLTGIESLQNLGLKSFSNTGGNIVYRLYGDLISQSGPLGRNVITVDSSLNEIIAAHPATNISKSHSIDNLVNALEAGFPQHDGFVGPTLDDVAGWIEPVLLDVNHILFDSPVAKGLVYTFDPPQGNVYDLISKNGSPYISALSLPSVDGIGSYRVITLSNGEWSNFASIYPGFEIGFFDSTSGFKFIPIDNFGNATSLPSNFVFDLTFASSGNFSADLYVANISAPVPEPETWIQLLFGFYVIGVLVRRNICNDKNIVLYHKQ